MEINSQDATRHFGAIWYAMTRSYKKNFLQRNPESLLFKNRPAPAIRRLLFVLVIVAAIAAVGVGARPLTNLNWIVEREDSLRKQIAVSPIASCVLAFLVYVGLSLIPGTAGKSIVVGWLFGFVVALFLVEIGLTTAAVISFLISRLLIKQLLHRRWLIYLRVIGKRFARDGAFYLLWLRVAHVPFTLVNYGAGATEIPLFTFWWTTHAGILPSSLIFTLIGSRIPSIRTVAEKGVWSMLDPTLLIVLVATAILPVVFSPWARKKLFEPSS